jgi:hypothetical protein
MAQAKLGKQPRPKYGAFSKAPLRRARCKSHDKSIEILQIMFTPQETELNLCVNTTPETVSKIAQSAKKEEEEIQAELVQMVENGYIFEKIVSEEGKTQELYSLLPTAPGLWEVTSTKKRGKSAYPAARSPVA